MKRIHLIISGDVVGVGYRSWTVRQTKGLGLVGWVKNRKDKTVELVAEGVEEKLHELILVCKKGPDVSWVENVSVDWQKATGEFVNFSVVY